jgi:AAA+ superfamily predicted ATPase
MQYVLKECQEGEHVLGASKITDKLITTAGGWLMSRSLRTVWVFDWYWRQDKALYDQVMKSSWDDVILDESMKKDLTNVTNKFFSSKDIYENLGVPWKRGLLFHGPPGNGKTVSIRALMHSLYDRDDPIPTLYVKDAPYTFHIREVFSQARALAPCMLILEDIETIVTPETRSYFFNEMDGLENNDGKCSYRFQ